MTIIIKLFISYFCEVCLEDVCYVHCIPVRDIALGQDTLNITELSRGVGTWGCEFLSNIFIIFFHCFCTFLSDSLVIVQCCIVLTC